MATLATVPCKSCKSPIRWIMMSTGRSMPVNPEFVTVVTEAGTVIKGHISHFATCPNAQEHRKVKK